MSYKWDRVRIKLDSGLTCEGIAPIIISASRVTDIPAFYSEWFFNRLRRGYVVWVNPFNRKFKQYVSFVKTRVIVFWTKNPKPMMKYLDVLDNMGINYYFQFTLNDYEREGFEPNLPSLRERISIFKELSELVGREKVIWRFDPLILAKGLDVDELLGRIERIGEEILPYTCKLVYSYIDVSIYKKVRRNLSQYLGLRPDEISSVEFSEEKQVEFAEKLSELIIRWKSFNPDFTVATCGEEIDLEQYGIYHNKCIDDDLMRRLFSSDRKLMEFLNGGTCSNLFGSTSNLARKDSGQRRLCRCVVSKDIGAYNTCMHLCVYCYANSFSDLVKKSAASINPESESLFPY